MSEVVHNPRSPCPQHVQGDDLPSQQTQRPRLKKKNLGNERMQFSCVWGDSVSSWMTLGQEFRHLIQVEDPETGRCQKNECRSKTRLEGNEAENRMICLEQNNYWIVSLSVPEEASRSAHNICKRSSKQSLPSKTPGSHTVDSDTTPMSRSWDIATNIRWSAEILRSGLDQVTVNYLRGGYERGIVWRHQRNMHPWDW
jgi:hypothetical protein